jgi:hypothetical protein
MPVHGGGVMSYGVGVGVATTTHTKLGSSLQRVLPMLPSEKHWALGVTAQQSKPEAQPLHSIAFIPLQGGYAVGVGVAHASASAPETSHSGPGSVPCGVGVDDSVGVAVAAACPLPEPQPASAAIAVSATVMTSQWERSIVDVMAAPEVHGPCHVACVLT